MSLLWVALCLCPPLYMPTVPGWLWWPQEVITSKLSGVVEAGTDPTGLVPL